MKTISPASRALSGSRFHSVHGTRQTSINPTSRKSTQTRLTTPSSIPISLMNRNPMNQTGNGPRPTKSRRQRQRSRRPRPGISRSTPIHQSRRQTHSDEGPTVQRQNRRRILHEQGPQQSHHGTRPHGIRRTGLVARLAQKNGRHGPQGVKRHHGHNDRRQRKARPARLPNRPPHLPPHRGHAAIPRQRRRRQEGRGAQPPPDAQRQVLGVDQHLVRQTGQHGQHHGRGDVGRQMRAAHPGEGSAEGRLAESFVQTRGDEQRRGRGGQDGRISVVEVQKPRGEGGEEGDPHACREEGEFGGDAGGVVGGSRPAHEGLGVAAESLELLLLLLLGGDLGEGRRDDGRRGLLGSYGGKRLERLRFGGRGLRSREVVGLSVRSLEFVGGLELEFLLEALLDGPVHVPLVDVRAALGHVGTVVQRIALLLGSFVFSPGREVIGDFGIGAGGGEFVFPVGIAGAASRSDDGGARGGGARPAFGSGRCGTAAREGAASLDDGGEEEEVHCLEGRAASGFLRHGFS
mmetsp:Transcript_30169/g.63533  ORF Transcript_30169/g.63533 Transcript_30169/m.63533 type:complete len:518 (-) Transcript_30169:16-1569(-)